jgi:hypothetical protein
MRIRPIEYDRIEKLTGNRADDRASVLAVYDAVAKPAVTFRQAAERFIESQRPAWSNICHAEGWAGLVTHMYAPQATQSVSHLIELPGLVSNKGIDLAISATALEHGLTVATRNVSDFEPTGVSVFNPFSPRSARKP